MMRLNRKKPWETRQGAPTDLVDRRLSLHIAKKMIEKLRGEDFRKRPLFKLSQFELPKWSGVYFLIDSSNRVLYVGSAQDIKIRCNQSHSKIKLLANDQKVYLSFFRSPAELTWAIEQKIIADLDPPLNFVVIKWWESDALHYAQREGVFESLNVISMLASKIARYAITHWNEYLTQDEKRELDRLIHMDDRTVFERHLHRTYREECLYGTGSKVNAFVGRIHHALMHPMASVMAFTKGGNALIEFEESINGDGSKVQSYLRELFKTTRLVGQGRGTAIADSPDAANLDWRRTEGIFDGSDY